MIYLRYLLPVHLWGIFFFTFFRCCLYFSLGDLTVDIENRSSLFFQAMLKGLQFDNLIACYIICLPLVVCSIAALFKKLSKGLVVGCNVFFILLYGLSFILCVSDIPYFDFFGFHLGVPALEWLKFGNETAGLIFQNTTHWLYIALLLVCILLFSTIVIRLGKRLIRAMANRQTHINYALQIPAVILIIGLCFAGMRGKLGARPLKVGEAYFSIHSFYNQLGLSPVFFLLKNIEKSSKHYYNIDGLMDVDKALLLVQEQLNVTDDHTPPFLSPIARSNRFEGEPADKNVVIVLMESLSSAYLDWEIDGKKTLSYLHELISKSYYFENFYSAGTHTNCGIMATHYGIPTLFNKPMTKDITHHYTGLPYYLRKKGYQTMFFISGDASYDNMSAVLHENDFDQIYSSDDYPSSKVVNSYGVQDDFLFQFGLEKLNLAAQANKPFLATVLTISHHLPYVIPDRFKNRGKNAEEDILLFADDCLKNFMENAAQQPWYNNTIFVFLGDHGTNVGTHASDIHLFRNHVPLIVYSPSFEDAPRRFEQFGGQIDVFPTVMGLLKQPYVNSTLGVDLLNDRQRPCMFFAHDNQLGCVNKDYLYLRNLVVNSDYLYTIHGEQEPVDMAKEPSAIGDSLKNYSVSMTTIVDYLIQNKLTGEKRSLIQTN